MEKLTRKWDTSKLYVPKPEFYQKQNESKIGMIFFGTSLYPALEAMDMFSEQGIVIDAMRVKAFPFSRAVEDFIKQHDQVFVIEQNRDAQLRSLLVNELEINPAKLIKILNYDGMPMTAENIRKQIVSNLTASAAHHHN